MAAGADSMEELWHCLIIIVTSHWYSSGMKSMKPLMRSSCPWKSLTTYESVASHTSTS